jgi:hypothetical protein
MHPALAGGAAVTSPPAITMPASPATMYRFMVRSFHEVFPAQSSMRVGRSLKAAHPVDYHATLPGAVRLDGPVAPAGGHPSSVQAAGGTRGRRADQPARDQRGSHARNDAELHKMTLTLIRRWFVAFDVMIR